MDQITDEERRRIAELVAEGAPPQLLLVAVAVLPAVFGERRCSRVEPP